MRQILLNLLLFCTTLTFAQSPISILSWNIRDLGKSKNEQELKFIANLLRRTREGLPIGAGCARGRQDSSFSEEKEAKRLSPVCLAADALT